MKTIIKPAKKEMNRKSIDTGISLLPSRESNGVVYKEVIFGATVAESKALQLINSYFEKKYKRLPKLNERFGEILKIADELEVFHMDDASTKPVRPITLYLTIEVVEQLDKEAKQHGLSLSVYLRTVMYSVGQYLIALQRQAGHAMMDNLYNNTNIPAQFYLKPSIKKAIEAKHGKMSHVKLSNFAHDFAMKKLEEEYGEFIK